MRIEEFRKALIEADDIVLEYDNIIKSDEAVDNYEEKEGALLYRAVELLKVLCVGNTDIR